mgnify:CR=1 FL=1
MEMNRRAFITGTGAAIVAGSAIAATAASADETATEAAPSTGLAESGYMDASAADGMVPSFMQPPEPITDVADTKSYDVVVVGAGASGLAAALRACQEGAKVAVVQKQDGAVSQGFEATGLLSDKNDEATKAAFVSKAMELSHYRPKRELLDAWAHNSGDAILWFRDILDAAGVEVQAIEDAGYDKDCDGYTAHFITARPTDTYAAAVPGVADYAAGQGVDFYYSMPAVQLVKDGDAVTGVIAGAEGAYTRFDVAKGVILSTGDYQNNQEMLQFYLPDVYGFPPLVPGLTGDGHRMGVWAGGHLEPINHTKMIHETWSDNAPFLMVGPDGKRFCNEHLPWFEVNNLMRSLMKKNIDDPAKSRVFSVLDAKYQDQMQAWSELDPDIKVKELPELRNEPDNFFCVVFQGDTLEEAAAMVGLDAEALQQTVDRYNELVAQGADDDFGKNPGYLAPIDTPPFTLVWRDFNYGLSAVLGGLVVDENNQVLGDDDAPIKGLYATGNVSGPFFGGIDYPMYFPGLSIGRAITTGYIAGAAAAHA